MMEARARQLRHFLTVYNRLNITAAAEDLHITQPALTRSIRSLEDHLGVSVFERLPNGVIPTAYGKALAQHASRIFAEYRMAESEIEALKAGARGHLQIGIGPMWTSFFVPQLVAEFQSLYPRIRLSTQEGMVQSLLPSLLAGDIDIIVGSADFPAHPDLHTVELGRFACHLTVGGHHPVLDTGERTVADLLKYPWAFMAGDHSGMQKVASFFASRGLEAPKASFSASSMGCILEVLHQGRFVTYLPEQILQSRAAAGLVSLPEAGSVWTYGAGVTVRRSLLTVKTIQHFTKIAQSLYQPSGSAPNH